jgi:hypothetical protein
MCAGTQCVVACASSWRRVALRCAPLARARGRDAEKQDAHGTATERAISLLTRLGVIA